MKRYAIFAILIAVAITAIALAGCGGGTVITAQPPAPTPVLVSGVVPISGGEVASSTPYFAFFFNSTMDTSSHLTGATIGDFEFVITKTSTGETVTIDETCASKYGGFSWDSVNIPNNVLFFRFFTPDEVLANGGTPLVAGQAYSLSVRLPDTLKNMSGTSVSGSLVATENISFTVLP